MSTEAREARAFIARWHHDPRLRLVLATVGGGVVAVLVVVFSAPAYAPLLGWATAACLYSLVTWVSIGRLTASQTAAHATREVPGGATVHLLLVLAALASLAGIAVLMFEPPGSRLEAAAVTLAVVVASWLTVQTLHALRYAREFYTSGGGVDFHTAEPPSYLDFAYMAFTVGMSFAISDTDLMSTRMRRIGLFHALLAYLFGTVFLAALVNILASLAG
ncbi:MAG: DUF1345 domain-containing protein [Propionibacteriaceae bacterium]|jgi:uncharacterized membrane protein|nr:DUF1345 domain-containing protein [Propionibacteriaceae bacterium]